MLIFYCPLWWLTQLYRTYGPSMYIYTACMHVCNTRKCTYIVWAWLLNNQISGFLDSIIQHATIPGEKVGALASLCKCTEGINCLTFSDSILSLDVYIKLFCALLDAIECGYLFLNVPSAKGKCPDSLKMFWYTFLIWPCHNKIRWLHLPMKKSVGLVDPVNL